MFERSYHFIPANRSKLFDRSGSLGADAYIFDLEDAVSRDEKSPAIVALDEWLEQQQDFEKLFVRVNGCEDPLVEMERSLILKYPQLGVVLPKVCSVEMLSQAVNYYQLDATRRIIGLIENAAGLQALKEILGLKILKAVGLGLEDFLSDSTFHAEQLEKLVEHIQTEIALAAMAGGIAAIDSISMDLTGGELLKRDISKARAAGLNGKFSIHPSQITHINEGFCPSSALLEKASSIPDSLTTNDLESGYLKVDEEIISPPKLKKLLTIKGFINHHGLTK